MQMYPPNYSSWSWRKILLIGLVLGGFFFSVGVVAAPFFYGQQVGYENGGEKNGQFNLELFWTVIATVEERFVDLDQIEKEKLIYGAIKGAVASLDDPYTVFMDPEESKGFMESLNGELQGIGAELGMEEGLITVITPLKGSPAEKAGVLPGDVIYKINDEETYEMNLNEAVMKIRGEEGTTVKLSLAREGVNEPIEVSIVRAKIEIESVVVEEKDGIVYLEVNQFNDRTNELFGEAISEMIVDKPKGIIVDLRFNGGGFLDIAVELLSYLLPSDSDAVIIKERGVDDKVLKTNGNPKILDVPVVVLVNEGSASASEIFAGAIQDHKRGVVMGAQTFGKGSVQEVDDFYDGSSLRVTIAKWFTPKDRGIDKEGLVPDIVVEMEEEDRENEYDRQRAEAEEYLKNL